MADNYDALPLKFAKGTPLYTAADARFSLDIGVLQRQGLSLTVREPLGLYMIDFDDTGFTRPDGRPAGDYWRVVRGRAGAALRVEYAVPAAEGFLVVGHPDRRAADPLRRAARRAHHGDGGRRGRAARVRPEVVAVLERLAATAPVLPRGIEPNAVGAAGEPGEPVYDAAFLADVQGNVIPGFNKDHQHFLFLKLRDAARARRWLAALAPRLATMDEALEFMRAHRTARQRTGEREPPLNSVWINVAFSFDAIAALAGRAEAAKFGDQSFKQGLAARSAYLGDPPGAARGWPVAGDVLVIVGADVGAPTSTRRSRRCGPTGCGSCSSSAATRCRARCAGTSTSASRTASRSRACAVGAGAEFITPRFLAAGDPHARLFAKPGQPLLWPGQFLLGEPRQDPQDLFAPAAAASRLPGVGAARVLPGRAPAAAGRRGVLGFVIDSGGRRRPDRASPRTLVGRWPSGAPLSRAPGADDPALGGDELANNHFLFEDDTRPSVLRPIPATAATATRPPAATCWARSARTSPTSARSTRATRARTWARPPTRSYACSCAAASPSARRLIGGGDPAADRGLLFAAYGATIEDQFEFITRRWINSALHPRSGGRDPLIGADRPWVTPTGRRLLLRPADQRHHRRPRNINVV